MNFDNKQLFIDKKIDDIIYTVNVRGIEERKITKIEAVSDSDLLVCVGKYYSSNSFKADRNSSVAKACSAIYYSDIDEAKSALYELRNKYLKDLRDNMIRSIREYEKMSSILRVYSDVNYTYDEWEQLKKGDDK